MTDVAKVPFASPAWLTAIGEAWAEAAASGALDGVEFSMCEVYTAVPPDVHPSGTVGWTLRISGGRATVVPEPSDDVDAKTTADYDVIAPLARLVLDGGWPPELADAIRGGKIAVVSNGKPLPDVTQAVHNEIARITA